MAPKSGFSYRPHKPAADECKTHGLVSVYLRETGEHLGMMNPTSGAYILRNREGERLSVQVPAIDDAVYLSRESAASILRQRIRQYDRALERRLGSVSEGCPNTWHNSSLSGMRASTPCPECPSQPGLKIALHEVSSLISTRESGGDDAGPLTDILDTLNHLIYTPGELMPAMDAYHRKTVLAEDLTTDLYAQLMEARIRSIRGELGNAVPSIGVYSKNVTGRDVVLIMRNAVEVGYTFYVSPHMESLVTAAAESLPEDDVIVASDLPTPQGFVWIPGGLTVLDIRGRILKYNGALWSSYGGRVFVWWMTDKYDETDMTNVELKAMDPEYWKKFPQVSPGGEANVPYGQPLPKMLQQATVIPPEYRSEMHWDPEMGLVFATDKGYDPDEIRALMTPTVSIDVALRWLIACWRLMGQSVTRLTDEPVPRGLQKLGRRAGLPDKAVTVIDLRSSASKGPGGYEVEWTHRWLRRGHWRKQPHKVDGEWQRKLIWIHPTVCGPEGLPLVIRDHVYNLKR